MKKKKLAIWMPGGVGGGYFSQGIPVITKLIKELGYHYDITVFSLYPTNPGFVPVNFKIASIHPFLRIQTLRWLLLIALFLIHHIKYRFEILYAFWGIPAGFFIVLLGKLFRLPSIIHLQGGDVVYLPKIKYGMLGNRFNKFLAVWSYNHASKLIALTKFQSGFLLQMGIKREVNIVPFGVDLDFFPFKEWSYDGKRELRCLHVANHTAVKDQFTLLQAFAILTKRHEARLIIIGENLNNGELQKHGEQLFIRDKIEFHEILPYGDLPSFYKWADVFILTSLYEGQAVVIAEAAASGNLLAGTRVGLLSDMRDECAITVNPGDSIGLAESIELTVRNPSLSKKLITSGYVWALKHDFHWSVKKIIETINRAG
jgi:glycosyltransferase involved in cell wall biosynthesis